MPILALVFVVHSCGEWPDVVESAEDVRRLDPKVTAVRTRSLPDTEIASLQRLENLRHLDFSSGHAAYDAAITDIGLMALSGLSLPRLEHLSLCYNENITNDGVAELGRMRHLRSLQLAACPNLTNDVLPVLAGMNHLRMLDLRGNDDLTVDGFMSLETLTQLERLLLNGCAGLDEEGVLTLRERLSWVQISKDDAAWEHLQLH